MKPIPAEQLMPITEQISGKFWPYGWWKLMEMRIGIIPLPVYLLLLALVAGFVATGKVPSDISVSIALLAVGGFSCAELGKRLPVMRNIGAAAIFATFIPSYLAFKHLLPAMVLKNVVDFTKSTNFLYLFIASIIVGSILSMDRAVLIKGFIKIFVPLAAGSVAAAIVGTAVGTLLGLGTYHTGGARCRHHRRTKRPSTCQETVPWVYRRDSN